MWKVAGLDGLTSEHNAHPVVVTLITYLFKLIFQCGIVPTDFGCGVIIPLHHIYERIRNGAERAENGVSGSGAVSGHSRKRLSGNGARSSRPRSGERVSQR